MDPAVALCKFVPRFVAVSDSQVVIQQIYNGLIVFELIYPTLTRHNVPFHAKILLLFRRFAAGYTVSSVWNRGMNTNGFEG
jgi:hypothetical protein